ncbi:hypothetical protein NVP1063O_073 [Vibrio phage 1.063.O._10N.261.45.C7]|nr:hypothetical protein NVP1063O_073 [Vibrio phage 1.063.O._10N.261.45.C7]
MGFTIVMKTQLIKSSSTLGQKVRKYVNWRYSGNRTCCCILVEGCCIKVITRCHKKDHYPTKLRNTYRRYTVHTEHVNQYQMNDLWSFKKDKINY